MEIRRSLRQQSDESDDEEEDFGDDEFGENAGGGDESLPMTEGSPSGHAQDSATAQGIEEEEVKEKQQAVEKEVAKKRNDRGLDRRRKMRSENSSTFKKLQPKAGTLTIVVKKAILTYSTGGSFWDKKSAQST